MTWLFRGKFHSLAGSQRIPDAERGERMPNRDLQHRADLPPNAIFGGAERRTAASYERELRQHRSTEARLRDALAGEEALLRQKDELIQQQEVLSKESDHRLLNGLQMIASVLLLQSRASANADTASQLAGAANRVATIGRVHRRLHSFDGMQTFAFKQYVEDICGDFTAMLPAGERLEQEIVVEGIEIDLPSATGIPLGFIVNELITNAAKYGKGRITVRLGRNPGKGYALSVSNDGPSLPEEFDPAAGKGMGMRIIRSFVERIGGVLRIARGDNNQGTRFMVQFS
jgi:two-component system, sensor histidine kinase PdtaS